MSHAVYRIEPDGTETPIGFTDDPLQIGEIIREDQDKIDYDHGYHVADVGNMVSPRSDLHSFSV